MFTYINGRFVRDKVVQHAIMQAYRGVIDRGRYPVVALFIQLPTGEVDVNVHPTKHEVRFRQQSTVHDAIQKAVEDVLRTSPWLDGSPALPLTTTTPTNQAYRERIAAAAQSSLTMTPRPAHTASNQTFINSGARETKPSSSAAGSVPNDPVFVHDPREPFRSEPARGYFSSLAIIGQFHGEYILCQSGTELVIIDQHAASERVAYQRLKQQCLGGAVESQRLLFPETVELSFSEVASAGRFHDDLTRIGFELEPFGGNTLIVTAVPRLIDGQNAIRLVRDILADLSQLGTSAAFQDRLDGLLSRIACHSVVRGVHPLEARQTAELLRSMDETDFVASCPHGRPVSHVVTLAELEKIFKRT
jgi:DNA mismatch repair protein MutL